MCPHLFHCCAVIDHHDGVVEGWVFRGICGRLLGVPRFAQNEFESELRDRLSSLGVLLAPLRVDHATVLATVKDKPAVALKSAILERRCARWPKRAQVGAEG